MFYTESTQFIKNQHLYGNIYRKQSRCMLMMCIWDKLTISPPVGFDIYSAQQTEAQWYSAYVLRSFSFKEWKY